MECLDGATIAQFAKKNLDEATQTLVRAHAATCARCAQLLSETTPTLEQPASAPPPAARLQRGDTLGRYVVLDLVETGGMGEVYAAFDPELDRRVAIKVLRHRAVAVDDTRAARLLREAQAMARVSHANVIAVHDVGVSNGRIFFAMDLVQGTTLKKWRQKQTRTWREVRAVYLAAGRGLAAAHAAGLVHRDFKPDNVLVGDDGAVKVTDFGIARALQENDADDGLEAPADAAPAPQAARVAAAIGTRELPPEAVSSHGSLSDPLTHESTIMGTPGYMAPEQYLCEPTDARSDQFAFCAALYEALYGERPFEGRTFEETAQAVVTGRVRDAPEGARVPSWIRRVLLRGLSAEAAMRYPSLDALLAELDADPSARARLVLVGLGVSFAVLALAALAHRTGRDAGAVCSGAPAAMAEVWSGEARARGERAFQATGLAFAPESWRHTREQLDVYAAAWTAAHKQACEATRVRGEQSEAVMTLRMMCLEERREQVRALTRLLGDADRQIVEKAPEASFALPAVADCADVASLTSLRPLPAEPAKRAIIEALRRDVAAQRALLDAGKYKDAVAQSGPLVEKARSTAYEPLLAEALLVFGEAQDRSGAKAAAEPTLRDGVYAAEAARADELKVRMLLDLTPILADAGRFVEARDAIRLARATCERLSDPQVHEAELLSANGWIFARETRYEEAAAELRRAIAIAERNPKRSKPAFVAKLYARCAAQLGKGGHAEEALQMLDRADAIQLETQGKDFPGRVSILVNKAAVLVDDDRAEEALPVIDTGLDLAARALPPESMSVANLYSNQSDALCRAGRPLEALASARRAQELGRKALGPKNLATTVMALNEANALRALGRSAEAIALYRTILPIFDEQLPKDNETAAEGRVGLAEALVATKRPREAIPELENVLAVYAKTPTGHATRANREHQARAYEVLAEALRATEGQGKLADEAAATAVAKRAELGKPARDAGATPL